MSEYTQRRADREILRRGPDALRAYCNKHPHWLAPFRVISRFEKTSPRGHTKSAERSVYMCDACAEAFAKKYNLTIPEAK